MENAVCKVDLIGTERCLWRYTVKPTGRTLDLAPPTFEVDGQTLPAVLAQIEPSGTPERLSNGATEFVYRGAFTADPNLALEMVFRLAPASPVVRFHYRLCATHPRTLTKQAGRDNVHYLGLSLAGFPTCREVRLSEFDEYVHSYRLTEQAVAERAFEHGLTVMGPLLIVGDATHTFLVAYEHGSQVPDAFLHYALSPERAVTLRAVKGNYYAGQIVEAGQPYETIWLQVAGVAGDEEALAKHYRTFVLKHLTLNAASRRPYVFYNTWSYQERNKWWNGQTYLASMNQERMLAEIDVAHRMGIEVFVIDTGWYDKTGDWRVSRARFPGGLAPVKERLERYGMKLGLWFSPTQAAVSSRILQEHADCRISRDGQLSGPYAVWETEDSFHMCLVSRYWEAFADELVHLAHEVGVTYFKWDAVGQYGCNDPAHWHGTPANSSQERADCYAFELWRSMARVVDRVCRACPEAIVDFDVTEGGRCVGLGFLAAGKYFLVNNGPYYPSFDDPVGAPGGGMGWNVFVFPGPARARVCRAPLDYDRWIPSVLFLTHYLPDDPASSQMINLASLVLGQNGVWGDLLNVSDEGVERFGHVLALYKQVRDDVTESYPVRSGTTGGSPEVHEKISERSGRGAVAIFASAPGRYTYVTQHPVAQPYWASDNVQVTCDSRGRARLETTLDQPGAVLVFFGVVA